MWSEKAETFIWQMVVSNVWIHRNPDERSKMGNVLWADCNSYWNKQETRLRKKGLIKDCEECGKRLPTAAVLVGEEICCECWDRPFKELAEQ